MAFKKICKYCGKIIEGLTENQAAYNHRLHEEACIKKSRKEKNKSEMRS